LFHKLITLYFLIYPYTILKYTIFRSIRQRFRYFLYYFII
jgi:hypothetical protein